MKTKLLLFAVLTCFSLHLVGQEKPVAADSTKKKLNCYVAGSLSTSTNDNFNQGTYVGVELGVCAKNMMFGFATGRGNLDFTNGNGERDFSSDRTENYWYEVKAYACLPIGSVKGYALAGWGQYYKTTHSFIEYGIGAAYSVKKFDFCITVSNWDKIVYVSPGIAFNFEL